ncbi:MAG: polysaccharide biosynthesis protein, partial [Deltaproteobacteria bacterium]|nr:polysaccharide biosynthesis protein [Deltaproteobacteria bacterium]
MKYSLLRRNFLVILCADVVLLAAAWYVAHLVRFDFVIQEERLTLLAKWLPAIILTKLTFFHFFDLYRGMWRYTSISDLLNILKASAVSSLFILGVVLFWTRFHGFSRSVFVIDWCLTILFISGCRLTVRLYFVRLYFELVSEDKPSRVLTRALLGSLSRGHSESKNLIIIGAGDCGEKIYREIHNNARLGYHVIGFLDDHPNKLGMKIHSIPVLGSIGDIKHIAQSAGADEMLIAIPSASAQQMRQIVAYCKES